MKRAHGTLLMAVLLAACATSREAAVDPFPGLRTELLQMGEEDQHFRDVDAILKLPVEEQQEFLRAGDAADQEHTARLEEIVAEYGWPTRSRVGEDGALAAFLLVQHADRQHVAYLTDRVRVKQGRPQLYGTQYESVTDAKGNVVADANGKLTYLPPRVEDPEHLDDRRRAVGLGPWIDYEREMAADQGRAPVAAPRSAGE